MQGDEKDGKNGNGSSMKFVGIFLAAVSGIFFTLCSVTVKLLPRIDPSEVLLFRAIVQMILTIPMLALMRANPLGPAGLRMLTYLQGKFLIFGKIFIHSAKPYLI